MFLFYFHLTESMSDECVGIQGSAGKSAQNVFCSHTFKNKDFNLILFLLDHNVYSMNPPSTGMTCWILER